MDLDIQIKTLVISFVFGMILSYIIKSQYKYFFDSKIIFKILLSIIFTFDVVLIYFLILRFINNGIFHIYFIFMIIIGYILGINLTKKR